MTARVWFLGVPVDGVTVPELIDAIRAPGSGGRIITVNLQFLALADRDAGFRDLVATARFSVADGMPVCWAARRAGLRPLARITGMDLLQGLTPAVAGAGHPVVFLGGRPGAAAETLRRLQRAHPHLPVTVWCPDPGFDQDPERLAELTERLRTLRPRLVFVGLGAPRQEALAARWAQELPDTWWIGVGGAFDLLAGYLPRAPRVLQVVGLEWAFRLAQEPRRLWRRYVCDCLPVVPRLGWAARRRQVPPDP